MLMIQSEISEAPAACTICQGVELNIYNDQMEVVGTERVGAIADIDLFASFTVDMEEAAKVVNQETGSKIKARGDLWEVSKRRETRFDNTVEKTTQVGRVGIEELQRRLAAGVDLWTGEAICEESEESDDE